MKTTKIKVKKEKKKKLNTSDLFHAWANKKETDLVVGNYSIRDGDVWYNNTQITCVKDKLLFIKKFSNTGSFGNGFNYIFLLNCLPDPDKAIVVQELPTKVTELGQLEHIRKEFFETESYYNLTIVSLYRNIITNKRRKLHTLQSEFDFNDQLHLLYGKKVYNKFLNSTIKESVSFKDQTGWGSHNYNMLPKVNLKFKVKDFIKSGFKLFFTDEEWNYLSYRCWCAEFKPEDYKCDQLLDNYNDLEKRTAWEKGIVDRKEAKATIEAREYQEKNKLEIIDILKNVDRFRTQGLIKSNANFLLKYQFLRLINNDEIRTSFNVTMKIEDAKKVLQLFRIAENKRTAVDGWIFEGILERNVPVLNSNGTDIEYINTKGVKIGCHFIPAFEIYNFLTYYKLNW